MQRCCFQAQQIILKGYQDGYSVIIEWMEILTILNFSFSMIGVKLLSQFDNLQLSTNPVPILLSTSLGI